MKYIVKFLHYCCSYIDLHGKMVRVTNIKNVFNMVYVKFKPER